MTTTEQFQGQEIDAETGPHHTTLTMSIDEGRRTRCIWIANPHKKFEDHDHPVMLSTGFDLMPQAERSALIQDSFKFVKQLTENWTA